MPSSSPGVYERVLRPLLFRLSPDAAHALARAVLRVPVWGPLGAGARVADPRLAVDLVSLPLRNPIGLAPGLDKSAEFLPSLDQLGFGYIVVGSITRAARPGNPFPRLVRYPPRGSIANSMGMPNRGLDEALRLLRSARRPRQTPIVASVAGFSAEELLESAQRVAPEVAAVEIGLVCPNTTETERMDELRIFTTLVDGLGATVVPHKPVFIKLPPHHNADDWVRVRQMLDACLRAGVQGVSVSGTRPIVEPRLGMGKGSLAGREVFADAVRITREVADHVHGRLAIKAAGGVFTGGDAVTMLEAGATTVEVYSALIYRGWDVAGRINRELLAALDTRHVAGLSELHARTPAIVEHR
jgi:dihydroorotate dehydrogenase